MWQKFLVLLWKGLSYVAARFLYGPFSRMWRWLFERKYKTLPIDTPWTTGMTLKFFRDCTWVADAWGGVLDIISKPEKFFETKQGDCDEFAVFASEVLPWETSILSVTWFDPKASWFKKFKGHNVCLYRYKDKYWHIGNWGKAGPFDSPRDAWNDVPPNKTVPCAFSLRKKDLKWFAGGIMEPKKE